MKKYLIILVLFPLIVGLSHSKKWEIIDRTPDYSPDTLFSTYYFLKCPDSLNCMAYAEINSGYGGYYFRRTTDGGASWTTVFKDSNNFWVPYIKDISYPNKNLFIGVGDSGLIIRSTNRGNTWEKYRLENVLNIVQISMYDEYFGFIQGYFKKDSTFMMITSDGGRNWKYLKNMLGLGKPAEFLNNDLVYGKYDLMEGPVIIFSRNSFQEYDTIVSPETTMNIWFIDENRGWAAGGRLLLDSAGLRQYSQIIYYTSDRGKSWIKQWDSLIFSGEPIVDLRFYDENFGIGSSFLGQVVITTDGGKHWKSEVIDSFLFNDGSAHYVDNIQFLNSTTALVVEDWRLIYKYTRDTTTDVSESEVRSEGVFPNPASDYITITLPSDTHTLKGVVEDVRLYDVFGQEATPVSRADTPAGGGQVRVDVSTLPAGVYFVRVGEKVSKFVKM